jgi:spore coat protein A
MKSRFIFNCFLAATLVLVGLTLWSTDAFAVDILPSQDTTIYEDFPNNSCGIGTGVFIGKNNRNVCSVSTETFCDQDDDCDAGETCDPPAVGAIRRGLLRFDIAESAGGPLPAGTTIGSVRLIMDSSRSGESDDAPATLHRIQPTAGADWGEGASFCDDVRNGGQGVPAVTGDATWEDRSVNNAAPWSAMGGDFDPFSATAIIPPTGQAIWDSEDPSNSAMVVDVQNWLDNPGMNYGWIVIGDEGRSSTSRRFDSREGRTPPILVVNIVGGVPCCDIDGEFLGICTEVPEGTCQTPPPDPNATSCEPDNPCPQPEGACCNQDESCSDLVTGAECAAAGGDFQGDGSACSDNQVDCGLEPFVDPLPFPVPVVQPVGTRADGVLQYEITMDQIQQQLHRDLPATDVWGYNGSYPGPTLEAMSDTPIEVTYTNNLPPEHYLEVDECPHGPNYWQRISRTSVHLHGANIMARFDGHPDLDIFPGTSDVFQYPNTQIPATLWYHDHGLGITRLNVYMGLAAYYMIRDDFENGLGLPSGDFEVPAVIQDREFNEDGTLFYPPLIESGGFFGDKTLVNGKVWPFFNVDQGKYRFRFLNGSQARQYLLRLENLADPEAEIPFTLIGTDGGLISAPISLNTFLMAPAERFDIVIDFSAFNEGDEIVLRNDDTADPRLPNVMKFIVTAEAGHIAALPPTLREVPEIPENEAGNRYRRFILETEGEPCSGTEWLVKSVDSQGNVIGQHWDELTEFPVLGTTEIWEFENPSNLMHPMHIHLVQFQILERRDLTTGQSIPLEPWEINTWKDTARVLPGTSTRAIMRFENWPGRFPYHCHILDHEDHEMMRQFQATNDPANCDSDGVCETLEDCVSCPSDCGIVNGAFCGNGLCEIGDGEDFVTCPEDCNGKTKGKSAFNCTAGDPNDPDNPGTNCGFAADGFTVEFDGCTTDGFYCRVAPRLRACCGDTLCEGQEQAQGPDFCELDCGPECQVTEQPEITCDDGIDNDCDGLPDAADPDCNGGIGEQGFCFDGVDNDNDTFTDCADSDCTGETNGSCLTGQPGICSAGTYTCNGAGGVPEPECVPNNQPETELCTDGLDNDCNGLPDCNDSACTDDPACQVNCSDITDRGECRNTEGCEWQGGKNNGSCQDAACTVTEDPEVSCSDGEDNDCDGSADCNDSDCNQDPACVCTPTPEMCTGGDDEDCDGLIDCADTDDCSTDPVCDVDCRSIGGQASCEAAGCNWNTKKMQCK